MKIDKRWFLKAWTFFRRGHGVYLVFFMSLMNFLVIQWRLLFEKVTVLNVLFERFTYFSIVVLLVYIPAAVFIGWFDYRKGSVPMDMEQTARSSPYDKDLARAVMHIANNENAKAVEVLKRWI